MLKTRQRQMENEMVKMGKRQEDQKRKIANLEVSVNALLCCMALWGARTKGYDFPLLQKTLATKLSMIIELKDEVRKVERIEAEQKRTMKSLQELQKQQDRRLGDVERNSGSRDSVGA